MRKRKSLVSDVIDTNLFVSGLINKQGTPSKLIDALRKSAFTLVLSESLHTEYSRVLLRPKFTHKYGITEEEIADSLFLVETNALRATPIQNLPVSVRDTKDGRVLAAALGGKANYLATGDEDLLVLRDDSRLGELKIVTAAEFLDILRQQGNQGHAQGLLFSKSLLGPWQFATPVFDNYKCRSIIIPIVRERVLYSEK